MVMQLWLEKCWFEIVLFWMRVSSGNSSLRSASRIGCALGRSLSSAWSVGYQLIGYVRLWPALAVSFINNCCNFRVVGWSLINFQQLYLHWHHLGGGVRIWIRRIGMTRGCLWCYLQVRLLLREFYGYPRWALYCSEFLSWHLKRSWNDSTLPRIDRYL
jgi:hypothetical protein